MADKTNIQKFTEEVGAAKGSTPARANPDPLADPAGPEMAAAPAYAGVPAATGLPTAQPRGRGGPNPTQEEVDAAKAAVTSKSKDKADKIYYLVNPAGTIHTADYEHAKMRLAELGWRSATKAEIDALNKAGGNQVHNKPLVEPWTPEPVDLDVEPK